MNELSNPQQTGQKKSEWRSAGMSLVFHVLALVLLAWFFTGQSGEQDGDKLRRVNVVLSTPTEAPSLFEYQDESDVTDSSQTSPSEAFPQEQPPNFPDLNANDLPGFEIDPQSEFDASQMTVVPKNSSQTEKYELSEDDLKFIAKEQALVRARAPKGNPVTTQIFGSGPLTGRRFLFVIDRSKSMGDSGLGVLSRARDELIKTLGDLEPEHSFQIVAYHQSTITIGERSLLAANESNKARVAGFMQGLAAFGATRHENGLAAGMAFRPDVLVFITDGGLPALNSGQVAEVIKMAGDRTQIHSLQFGSGGNQSRDNFMSRIASETGGSYRYIDVNDWHDN